MTTSRAMPVTDRVPGTGIPAHAKCEETDLGKERKKERNNDQAKQQDVRVRLKGEGDMRGGCKGRDTRERAASMVE